MAPARAQDTNDLAKQVQNPVANLISLPLESSWDFGLGRNGRGYSYTLNVQPVVPFSLNENWNLITRTIAPVMNVSIPGAGSHFGLGDVTQSFFLSPAQSKNGVIWGVGPVFLYPTASKDALGGEKFGAGPTGVALIQRGPWTVGMLANHIWSLAGNERRPDVSLSYLQPFVAYSLGGGYSVSGQSKISYNWENERATVAFQGGFSKVFALGGQAMSAGLQGRVYANRPSGGPDWGVTFSISMLFPKK